MAPFLVSKVGWTTKVDLGSNIGKDDNWEFIDIVFPLTTKPAKKPCKVSITLKLDALSSLSEVRNQTGQRFSES